MLGWYWRRFQQAPVSGCLACTAVASTDAAQAAALTGTAQLMAPTGAALLLGDTVSSSSQLGGGDGAEDTPRSERGGAVSTGAAHKAAPTGVAEPDGSNSAAGSQFVISQWSDAATSLWA